MKKTKIKYTLMNMFWGFDGLDSELLDESWDKAELEKMSVGYEHSYILEEKVPITETKLFTKCPRCGWETEKTDKRAFSMCEYCEKEFMEEELRTMDLYAR